MSMLGDQVFSPEMYQDALLLSHLARSVLSASCAAVEATQGRLDERNPTTCAADPRAMAAFGDRDTMAMLGRLYRKIALTIGATDEVDRRIEEMIPATTAGLSFDLVGMITGLAPRARIVGDRFTDPSIVDFLSIEGPGTAPKASKVPLILGFIGVVAGGLAVGWALSRD